MASSEALTLSSLHLETAKYFSFFSPTSESPHPFSPLPPSRSDEARVGLRFSSIMKGGFSPFRPKLLIASPSSSYWEMQRCPPFLFFLRHGIIPWPHLPFPPVHTTACQSTNAPLFYFPLFFFSFSSLCKARELTLLLPFEGSKDFAFLVRDGEEIVLTSSPLPLFLFFFLSFE